MEMTLTKIRRRVDRLVFGDDYDRADGVCRQGPEWLVLVVNNFCNLRCRMCDVGLGESASVFFAHLIGDDPRNMSLDLLETILEQAESFSPKPKVGLAFTEPLIHRDVLAFCRAIVERGFFCSITTNGWMLPRLAEQLVEIGVHEITVSVDGPDEVHDQVRGKKGSFRNLYSGVEAVNEARKRLGKAHPLVRFSYTLTDVNYTHMTTFLERITPLRPESVIFSHLNFVTSEMATAHNQLVTDEWRVTRSNLGTMDLTAISLPDMWQALNTLKAHIRSTPGLPPVKIVPDVASTEQLDLYYHQPLQFVGGRQCTDPWKLLMIRTDGTAIPAHGRCYNVPLGNVRDEPLASLWNNGRARQFRQTLKAAGGTLPACSRCCGIIGK